MDTGEMSKEELAAHRSRLLEVDLSLDDIIATRREQNRTERTERKRQHEEGREAFRTQRREEKEKRMARFGIERTEKVEADVDEVKVLEPRTEAPMDLERRPHLVHVYGVDMMGNDDILRFFKGGQSVEWINDSSCNVMFRDDDAARASVLSLGHIIPTEEEGSSGADVDVTDTEKLAWHWHRAREAVSKEGVHYVLQFRIATVEDRKPMGQPKRSRFLWKSDLLGVKSDVRKIIDRRRGNDPNKVVKQGRRGAAREGIFSYDAFLQDVGLAPAGAGAGAGMGELEEGGVKEEEKPRVGAPLAEEMDAVDYGDL